MAAALAASRAGWDVRMYERVAEFSEVGAGVQLGPNVVRCLQAWGCKKPCSRWQRFLIACRCAAPSVAQSWACCPGAHGGAARWRGLRHHPPGGSARPATRACSANRCPAVPRGLAIGSLHRRQPRGPGHSGGEDGGVGATSQGKEIEGDALIGADGFVGRTRTQLLGYQAPRDGAPWPAPWCGKTRCQSAAHAACHNLAGATAAHGAVPPCGGESCRTLVVIVKALRPQNLENHGLTPTRATWNPLQHRRATRRAWRRSCRCRLAPVAAGDRPPCAAPRRWCKAWWRCWAMPPPHAPTWRKARAWRLKMPPSWSRRCPCMTGSALAPAPLRGEPLAAQRAGADPVHPQWAHLPPPAQCGGRATCR